MSQTFPLLLHAIRAGADDGAGRGSRRVRDEQADSSISFPTVESAEPVLARIRAGDEPAFLDLYRTYYPGLCDFALRYTHDSAIAEDIVSDVFLSLWRGRSELSVRGTIKAYLFSAIRYRALNSVRNTKRHATHHSMSAAAGYSPGMSESSDILRSSAQHTLEQTVWSVIETLPERSRIVMILRWREQMALSEIAQVVGTTEMAVRQLHKRALATLRSQLAPLIDLTE